MTTNFPKSLEMKTFKNSAKKVEVKKKNSEMISIMKCSETLSTNLKKQITTN